MRAECELERWLVYNNISVCSWMRVLCVSLLSLVISEMFLRARVHEFVLLRRSPSLSHPAAARSALAAANLFSVYFLISGRH